MPRIPPFTANPNVPRMRPSDTGEVIALDAARRAASAHLGRTVTQQRQKDAAAAARATAELRQSAIDEFLETQKDAATGAPNAASAVLAEIEAEAVRVFMTIPDSRRDSFARSMAVFQRKLEDDADLFEAVLQGEKVAGDAVAAIDLSAKTLTIDPDRFEELLANIGTMIEAFAIPEESKRDFLDGAKRKLAWNAITGLRDRQGPEAALEALDGGTFDAFLPAEFRKAARDGAAGALREQRNREAARKAEATQAEALEVGRLKREIDAGSAGMAEITDAFTAGRIGEEAVGALFRRAGEKAAELAEKTERVETIARRLSGDGPPLDPTAPDDVAAADFYYDETVLPALGEQDPTARAGTIANAVVQLGVMPKGARTFRTHALRADDAPLQLASAEAVDRVARKRPELAADLDSRDVAFAQAIAGARRAGVPDQHALDSAGPRIDGTKSIKRVQVADVRSRRDFVSSPTEDVEPTFLEDISDARRIIFTAPPTDLDDVENDIRQSIRIAERLGIRLGAKMLRHFLEGNGKPLRIARSEALGLGPVAEAQGDNLRRFELSFIGKGKSGTKSFRQELLNLKDGGEQEPIIDHWIRSISGAASFSEGELNAAFGLGDFDFRSDGIFWATRSGNIVTITGTATHSLNEDYNFEPGKRPKNLVDRGLILQNANRGQVFQAWALWRQELQATLEIKNGELQIVSITWSDATQR